MLRGRRAQKSAWGQIRMVTLQDDEMMTWQLVQSAKKRG
jgi:hypothetical protein